MKKKEPYIFNKEDFSGIKKAIENIDLKFKLYHIKKLDFNKHSISDDEMNFIFQYDYINLEYLDIQKNGLTDKGIKSLQNKSLSNIKYLNISKNNITDVGLTYLNYLNNVNEFVLMNMNKLSNDYFLSLEKCKFAKKMKIFRCDKSKLSLSFASDSYNEFILPNLTSLRITKDSKKVCKILKYIFQSNNICSKIKEIDLSETLLRDNGMSRLAKNISLFKNLKSINLEGSGITTYSTQSFKLIHQHKIKIILNQEKLKFRVRRKIYHILLAGSEISGKTSYFNSYVFESFCEESCPSVGCIYTYIKYNKLKYTKFKLWDSCRWGGRFDSFLEDYIFLANGIILLFDLSVKKDFDNLSICLRMISDYHELEEFPVLLVGNKADLPKEVKQEEIDEFVAKEGLIGYFEVSCKASSKVEESLKFMVDYISQKEMAFPPGE